MLLNRGSRGVLSTERQSYFQSVLGLPAELPDPRRVRSQADCFSDSRCLPPPPRCIMIYSMTTRCRDWKIKTRSTRCLTLITWWRETCKQVLKAHTWSLHPVLAHIQIGLRLFKYSAYITDCTGQICTHTHTACLSLGQDTIKSVRAG